MSAFEIFPAEQVVAQGLLLHGTPVHLLEQAPASQLLHLSALQVFEHPFGLHLELEQESPQLLGEQVLVQTGEQDVLQVPLQPPSQSPEQVSAHPDPHP